MPRPKKCRRLGCSPEVICFKPAGIRRIELENVIIEADEFEAFKLVAYDQLQHEEAAQQMEISRPTLTRIYNVTIRKISKALVEGKAIEIAVINPSKNASL